MFEIEVSLDRKSIRIETAYYANQGLEVFLNIQVNSTRMYIFCTVHLFSFYGWYKNAQMS